jgi:hypothetical protein
MQQRQSGSVPRGVDPSRVVAAKEYLERHPQPVILHFKPTGFVQVEAPGELRRWEAKVRDLVGLPVATGKPGSGSAGTISDTICALSEGAIEDDCDYD